MQESKWLAAGSVFAAFVIGAFHTPPARSQARVFPDADTKAIYDRLLPQIQQIRAFDNHGHPGFPDDPDVDAMAIPSDSSVPFRLRDGNPELLEAAKAIDGYPYSDFSPEHLRWLINRKAEGKKSLGEVYFPHILDQAGIETAIANRVSMPSYLIRERFRWVFFVDSFLFPFDTSQLESKDPDQKLNVPLQRKLLARELARQRLNRNPMSFQGYLSFIRAVVEASHKAGGVGMKFEIAYFRSLRFGDPTEQRAAAIYAKYRAGGVPRLEEYRDFQDYIFRYLLLEAARLHLPVQIHTSVGGGDFFSLEDGDILLLENVLRDPRYDKVTFVLLHGGFPHDREAIWLAARKNVYLDSSLMGIFLYPDEFRRVLKQWLEVFPDKIVFGTDTFPLGDAFGAEETYWLATQSARTALAGALAEMVSTHAVSEQQAMGLAHAYLHDTAAKLYAAPQ
jgi:uncharacterized protein